MIPCHADFRRGTGREDAARGGGGRRLREDGCRRGGAHIAASSGGAWGAAEPAATLGRTRGVTPDALPSFFVSAGSTQYAAPPSPEVPMFPPVFLAQCANALVFLATGGMALAVARR